MSSQARPSLDGIAQEVLAKGRRARRARTAKVASAVLVAAGLVGAAVAVAVPGSGGSHPVATGRDTAVKSASPATPASPARPGPRTAPVGGANAVPAAAILTDASSPAAYIPQPAGPKAPTSSAAILDELLKLLPPGATSHYAFDGLGAETYLDGASGLGTIRLSLFKGSLNPDACTSAVPSDMTRTCSTLPGGATVLTTRISDNCIEPLVIDVDHGAGTVAEIDVATCLPLERPAQPVGAHGDHRCSGTADRGESRLGGGADGCRPRPCRGHSVRRRAGEPERRRDDGLGNARVGVTIGS